MQPDRGALPVGETREQGDFREIRAFLAKVEAFVAAAGVREAALRERLADLLTQVDALTLGRGESEAREAALRADLEFERAHVYDLIQREAALRHALERIASYNVEELRSWGEENAADMVAFARQALEEGSQ